MMSRTREIHALKILAAVGALLLLWGLVLAYSASPAQAATINVTSLGDGERNNGNCTLREAIRAANANTMIDVCTAGSVTEPDTILFAVGQGATIPVSSRLPDITDGAGLTINGPQKNITINGNDASPESVFVVQPGAVFNLRNLTVADGISGFGAGLLNNGGEVKVSNSTFTGNSAGSGGGIRNSSGTLKVINSTFSGNSATNFGGVGGGIMNQSSLVVSNSTFSDNSATDAGGGIFVAGSTATATLKNTIVANSTQGDCTIDAGGAVTDGGFNLIEDGSCITKASSRSGDPLLGALAENGGPTQTMALQDGSPAIDKGKAFGGATTDQRGLPRPVDFPLITNRGDGSDIGAFEVQP